MAGVSLVGYSGSLIKDTLTDVVNLVTDHDTGNPDQVDVTKALVGMRQPCHSCFVSCNR